MRFGILATTFIIQVFASLAIAQYIDLSKVDLKDFPAPPADGSPEHKKDLEIVLQYQAKATDKDCVRAKAESKMAIENTFVHDGPLTAEEAKVLSPLFEEMHDQADVFVKNIKNRWKRIRPYKNSKLVQQKCGEGKSEFSYPSGHSTTGYLSALAFAEVIPSKAKLLLERGKLVGDDRVMSGVHYLRDVEAGRELASKIFVALKADPKFQDKIKKMKLEIQKIH